MSYSESSATCDCQSPEFYLTTAVVASSASTITALCIISCVIGALLRHILASLPCWTSRKPTQTTEEPQHLYDEITLTDTSAATGHSDSNEQKIVTMHNRAYSDVQLS